MFDILADLIVIYLFSFLTGFGLYRLLTPGFLKQASFGLVFIPGLGLLQLTIVSAYLIYLSVPVVDSLYVSAVVGLATLIAAVLLDESLRQFAFTAQIRRILRTPTKTWISLSAKAGLFAVLLAVVMAPAVRAGMPTTPYRYGIDQVGYAETAQYLLEGGTLNKIRVTLLAQLNTADMSKAKAQNLRALNFQTYVDSEFLLKAYRWGFPGTLAALTFLTGSTHVYKVEFLLDVFSYALMLVLAFRILRDYFRLPSGPSFAVMSVLALNCNLINVYYEGQLTQIFTLPYFTLTLILYLRARSATSGKGLRISSAFIKSLLLFILLVAFMYSAYNEALVLLVAFVVVVSLLDLVFYRRIDRTSLVYAGLGFLGGFIAVLPFSNQWLFYTIANLRRLSVAGFWQPHWGSFAEILGFLNMYHPPWYVLLQRSLPNEVISIVLSILLAAVFVRFMLRTRDLDSSFWIAPPAIILAAYLKMNLMDHILNYPYMKIYIMLTPLLVCVVFSALYRLTQDKRFFTNLGDSLRQRGGLGKRFGRYVATRGQSVATYAGAAALITVAVTGVVYISQYLAQSGYVNADMFSMYKYTNGARQFNDLALLVPRRQPSIADLMLVPIISMNLVNENDAEKYIAPYLEAPVGVIFRSDDLLCRTCFIHRFSKQIAYMNDSYVLLSTGEKLKDICTKEAKRYTLSTLNINDNGDWPDLPGSQCDYTFGLKYLSAQ